MAQVVIRNADLFPDGTSVGAWDAQGFVPEPHGKAPPGRAVQTVTMTAGSATFDLPTNKTYVFAAFVNGAWRYLLERLDADEYQGSASFVNLADFGVKGDGISDDTVAVQEWIAELDARGGGTAYAPAGEYLVSERITMPDGIGWTVRGDGPGATLFTLAEDLGDGCFFDVEDAAAEEITSPYKYRALRDLSIEGPDGGGTAPNEMGGIRWVSNLLVENVVVRFWKYGALIYGNHQHMVKSFLTECQYGAYLPDDTPSIADYSFDHTVLAGNRLAGIGIAPTQPYEGELYDCHFGFEPYGIYAEAGSAAAFETATFSSCYCESFGRSFIQTNGRWINHTGFNDLTLRPDSRYKSGGSLGYVIDAGADGGVQNMTINKCVMFDPPNSDYPAAFIGAGLLKNCEWRGMGRVIDKIATWPAITATDGWPVIGSSGNIDHVTVEWGRHKALAFKPTEDIGKDLLVSLAGFDAEVVRGHKALNGEIPLGVSLYECFAGYTQLVGVQGLFSCASTGAISEAAYVKPASTGKVAAASSFSDGPIVGIAGDGGAVSNVCPVFMRLSA